MKTINEAMKKLQESKRINESSEEVERYRDWLKSTQQEYKSLDKNDPRYRMNYNDILKREKEYLKALKKALAEEKGTFVSPLQLTNAIKKLGNMQKYTDQTTSVRGFHWYGKGDFSVDLDTYNTSLNEDDLYYDVYFYGKYSEAKTEVIYNALKDAGFNVEKVGGNNTNHLYVMNYK